MRLAKSRVNTEGQPGDERDSRERGCLPADGARKLRAHEAEHLQDGEVAPSTVHG
jgi:hypothetical protein